MRIKFILTFGLKDCSARRAIIPACWFVTLCGSWWNKFQSSGMDICGNISCIYTTNCYHNKTYFCPSSIAFLRLICWISFFPFFTVKLYEYIHKLKQGLVQLYLLFYIFSMFFLSHSFLNPPLSYCIPLEHNICSQFLWPVRRQICLRVRHQSFIRGYSYEMTQSVKGISLTCLRSNNCDLRSWLIDSSFYLVLA